MLCRSTPRRSAAKRNWKSRIVRRTQQLMEFLLCTVSSSALSRSHKWKTWSLEVAVVLWLYAVVCVSIYRPYSWQWALCRTETLFYLSYLWLLPGVGDEFLLRDIEPFEFMNPTSWWCPPISVPMPDMCEFFRDFFLFFSICENCFFSFWLLLLFLAFFNSARRRKAR